MKFLILGATGMLGHKLIQEFRKTDEVIATARGSIWPDTNDVRIIQFWASDAGEFKDVLEASKPDVVINCIGVIKQLGGAKDPLVCVPINSLFPHQISKACQENGVKFVHVSTDCVFSGRLGRPYTEEDVPDPTDLYGRTKLVGEAGLTLRTSIIGRETKGTTGLIEWFLSQKGKTIKGFSKALYTGFTTIEFARVIRAALAADLAPGVYQASSDPISKLDLLNLAKEKFGIEVNIEDDDKFECDRRLDSSRFRRLTSYAPPTWNDMLAEMASDPTPYEEWRKHANR